MLKIYASSINERSKIIYIIESQARCAVLNHRFDYNPSRCRDDKIYFFRMSFPLVLRERGECVPFSPKCALSSIDCDVGILIGYREVLQILIREKYEFYSSSIPMHPARIVKWRLTSNFARTASFSVRVHSKKKSTQNKYRCKMKKYKRIRQIPVDTQFTSLSLHRACNIDWHKRDAFNVWNM